MVCFYGDCYLFWERYFLYIVLKMMNSTIQKTTSNNRSVSVNKLTGEPGVIGFSTSKHIDNSSIASAGIAANKVADTLLLKFLCFNNQSNVSQ